MNEKHDDFQSKDADPEVVTIDGERALAEKRLVRRIDLRMSPLIVIYILNYLDRNNASAARLRGMQEDLAVNDTQWATILSILYVGYITYRISSTIARPTSKRAVALGLINGLSQLGRSYVWPSKWGPTYINSNVICISCFAGSLIMSYLFKLHLEHLNRKLDEGEATVVFNTAAVEDAARLEGLTVEDALAARKGWRYLV